MRVLAAIEQNLPIVGVDRLGVPLEIGEIADATSRRITRSPIAA